MQLNEWAENILNGARLEDKLQPLADSRSDDVPFTGLLPKWPARTPKLSLVERPPRNNRYFHQRNSVDHERAAVFHFFANHELLALELMALALLKFSDAPTAFRRGIAATMQDEQRHLQQYLTRMRQLGMEFGDLPLNSFFWRTISPMASPEEFVANLSLTFEQANLDYALYYQNEFAKLDDKPSAITMREVYEDEIAHVHFGKIWLEHFRPKTQTTWEYYQQNLRPPITPARAKGKIFDLAGRKRAGLGEDFISEIKIYNRSKSKPPVLYHFNLAAEGNAASQKIANDLASLFLFAAGAYDSVYTAEPLDSSFVKKISEYRAIPELITAADSETRLVDRIETYRPADETEHKHLCKTLNLIVQSSSAPWTFSDSKRFSRDLIADLRVDDNIASLSLEEAMQTDQFLLVKGDRGSSAQANYRISPENRDQLPEIYSRLSRQFGEPIIEPFHQRLADFSVLFDGQRGPCQIIHTICDRNGRFTGIWQHEHLFFNLREQQKITVMHREQLNFSASTKDAAQKIVRELRQRGYQGRGSIDGYLYHDTAGRMRIRRACEINCRWTMGHFFQNFKNLLPKPAIWLLFNQNDCKRLGCENFGELYEYLAAKFAHTLPTNAPITARLLLGVYIHDPKLLEKLSANNICDSKWLQAPDSL